MCGNAFVLSDERTFSVPHTESRERFIHTVGKDVRPHTACTVDVSQHAKYVDQMQTPAAGL